MCQGGVDTSLVRWVPYDGLGRSVRNGLNFTERGFGVRGAIGVSDRGHTAASQMQSRRHRLGSSVRRRRRALAPHRRHLRRARRAHSRRRRGRRRERPPARHDRLVRPQLPAEPLEGVRRTGSGEEVNRRLVAQVDVLIGNEEDFTAGLGFEVPGVDAALVDLEVGGFEAMTTTSSLPSPTCAVVATTLRGVLSATATTGERSPGQTDGCTRHAPAGARDPRPGRRRRQLRLRADLRADEGFPVAVAVEYGAAHGALAMTTPATPRWRRSRRSSASWRAAVPASSGEGVRASVLLRCQGATSLHVEFHGDLVADGHLADTHRDVEVDAVLSVPEHAGGREPDSPAAVDR